VALCIGDSGDLYYRYITIASMKKSELAFSALLVPVDALMLVAAGLFVYELRFNNAWIVGLRPVLSLIGEPEYIRGLLIVALVGIAVFAFGGLYTITSTRTLREEIVLVSYGCATLLVLVILGLFFARQIFFSRLLILGFLVFSILFVFIGRLLVRSIQRLFFQKGIGAHRVVILGAGETADALLKEFAWHPELGYRVIDRIKTIDGKTRARLEDLHRLYVVDEVLVADPRIEAHGWQSILAFADSTQRIVKYAADVTQRRQTRREMIMVGTVPVVEFKRTRLEGWGRVIKRIFDIVVSGILIVITSPIMLIAAMMIKADSSGPVFFRHLDDGSPVERVGETGMRFRYLKFRTMLPGTHGMRYGVLSRENTRADGPLVKLERDPRVTKVGRWLRRYSLDELPELFLVFIGAMSLVGPRPHFPEEVGKYTPDQRRVLTVKPGMTGMAQISGRSDLLFDEEVRLDLYYIENWSLLMDLWIVLKTPFVVLRGKSV